MDADFSVELGPDDPVLDFPWHDPEGHLRCYDLKLNPELVVELPETRGYPELVDALRTLNAPASPLQTAKCDTWITGEISEEERIFGGQIKCASYIDLIFTQPGDRVSFPRHQTLARAVVAGLQQAGEMAAAVELLVRRCYFGEEEGFCITAYVSGFGGDPDRAHLSWGTALKLLAESMSPVAP